jgi:protein-disulfide isomerase
LEYATDLGLDAGQLLSDLQSGKHRTRVREDFQSGIRSGVDGTPTFYINDTRYDGPLEAGSLLASLQHAAED